MTYKEEAHRPMSMHPKKFALWLFLVSITMLFAAWTSYYIVRKSEGKWLEFDLPNYFWISTFIIIISSATMHWTYIAAKKDDLQKIKLALFITTMLGITFLIAQFLGWVDLYSRGIVVGGSTSNAAGSILYLLSAIHGAHVIGGVIFLLVVFMNSLNSKIHSKNLVQLEMCATYWHFLDGLWVYLFVFLLLNR